MYRKLSALLALLLALAVFAALPVLAEEEDDGSEPMSLSLTTEDGITVEIGEAYYEGDRVYVSYRVTGDMVKAELHEGAPEGITEWKYTKEDVIAAEQMSSDNPEAQKGLEWLDGKGQRWTETWSFGLSDGLDLEDGNYADIVDGDSEYKEDGTLVGWKKCKIPPESKKDTLTFKLILSRGHSIAFQDYTTYHRNYERGEKTEICFTLSKDERVQCKTGTLHTDAYDAKAEIVSGRDELRCTITLTGVSEEWENAVNTWNSENFTEMTMPDIITGWNLYQNGSYFNTDDVVMYTTGPAEVTYEILVPGKDNGADLKLVPVYEESGEHTKETVYLKEIVKSKKK